MILYLLLALVAFSESQHRIPHEYHYPHLGPDNVTQISGYITVNGTVWDGTHLFYWFFESRTDPDNAPFLVWLTGGPGCSSMLALLSENGPYTVDKDLNLIKNLNSWNEFANIMWIDQPAGTGFSYTDNVFDYDVNEKQVAKDMWMFLQEFFLQFPKYQKLDLYILGESYAGHYVPAVSYKIYEMNQQKETLHLNFKGMAIGDGWTDPYNQYRGYTEFAKYNKLINDVEYAGDIAAAIACQELVKSGVWPVAFYECQLYTEAVMEEISVHQGFQINPYNYKIPCADPPLCYNFDDVTKFLNEEHVKKALGVKKKWDSCNMLVHFIMLGDWISDLEVHIPNLLNDPQKLKVLIYHGEDDYICNWKGGEDWTSKMSWKYQDEFNKQSYKPWMIDGKKVGEAKEYENFTFLKVENAGHMVPMDQPENALNMLKHFLEGSPFSDE